VNNAVSTALGYHAAAALAPKPSEFTPLASAALTAPGQASPTNVAQPFKAPPVPGSMADKMQRALMAGNLAEYVSSPIFDQLVKSRGAGVALMALAHNAETAAADTTAGNIPWDVATSGQDVSQPTSAPVGMTKAQQIQQAISGQFADLAAAEGGGGALAGAARVAGAEYRRRREEEKDRVNMAMSNAQMLHEQMLVHKLGEEQVNEQAKSGKQAEQMALLAPKAELKAEGKTSDELGQMIRDKKIDPTRDMVFLTGRTEAGRDKNGQPMFRSVYSVVTPGGPMTVDENAAKYINGVMPWQKIPVGTEMPAPQFYGLWQQAQNIQASMQAAQKFNDDLAAKDKEAKLTENDQRFFAKTAAMQAVSKFTNHTEDPFGAVKAYNALKIQAAKDPKLAAELGPDWEEQFMHAWGNGSIQNFKEMDKEYRAAFVKLETKIKDNLNEKEAISNPPGTMALAKSEIDSLQPITQKAQGILDDPKATKEDKDEANEALKDANTRMEYAKRIYKIAQDTEKNKAEEERLKQAGKEGFQGNPNAITPEEFLASLKPNEAALVREMGTGKMPISRIEYLAARQPALLEAVSKAYPGFDGSKISGYVNTYKDFTSGKTAIALNAGATAMGHLKELFDLNTNASHIPHSSAWTAYQNKADTLATELAKFYGDATIPAIAAIKSTLTSTLPGNREAAIKTQAQSMGDKLESFEQQWKNAAPSEAYQAPMPFISLKAKRAFASLNPEYAAAHPELQAEPSQKQQAAPNVSGGGHQVGDIIMQNGHQMKVTAVDKDGRVTNAE
jgi:hypothetical protein